MADSGKPELGGLFDEHVASMPRPAVRLAVEKLPADLRARYV